MREDTPTAILTGILALMQATLAAVAAVAFVLWAGPVFGLADREELGQRILVALDLFPVGYVLLWLGPIGLAVAVVATALFALTQAVAAGGLMWRRPWAVVLQLGLSAIAIVGVLVQAMGLGALLLGWSQWTTLGLALALAALSGRRVLRGLASP